MNIFLSIPPFFRISLLVAMENMCFNIKSLFLRNIFLVIWVVKLNNLSGIKIVLGCKVGLAIPRVQQNLSNRTTDDINISNAESVYLLVIMIFFNL